MSDSRQWGSRLISWLAAAAAAVMVALVLLQPERDFWPDHVFLTAVFTAMAACCLRDARLLAGAAAFALATTWLNLGPPVGPDPLRSMVKPAEAPPEEYWAWVKGRAERQVDAQRRLYVFVGLNGLASVGLLAVARRMGRRAERRPASGRIEPLPILAIKEGVNGQFGARSRKRSAERRGIMGSYVMAMPLLAMFCGVVVFPIRSFEVDGIVMVALIATAAVWYLRDPSLAAAAVAFAVLTWCLDFNMLLDAWAAPAPGTSVSSPSSPATRTVAARPPNNTQDDLSQAQSQLHGFLIVNSVWFGGLMVIAALLRKHRAASEAEGARAPVLAADPRLSRMRV